jgi:alkyl hydroperoxide reductase subunit AhpF
MQSYEMVVIGSRPAGQRAAMHAAKVGKLVGVLFRGLGLRTLGLSAGVNMCSNAFTDSPCLRNLSILRIAASTVV